MLSFDFELLRFRSQVDVDSDVDSVDFFELFSADDLIDCPEIVFPEPPEIGLPFGLAELPVDAAGDTTACPIVGVEVECNHT